MIWMLSVRGKWKGKKQQKNDGMQIQFINGLSGIWPSFDDNLQIVKKTNIKEMFSLKHNDDW